MKVVLRSRRNLRPRDWVIVAMTFLATLFVLWCVLFGPLKQMRNGIVFASPGLSALLSSIFWHFHARKEVLVFDETGISSMNGPRVFTKIAWNEVIKITVYTSLWGLKDHGIDIATTGTPGYISFSSWRLSPGESETEGHVTTNKGLRLFKQTFSLFGHELGKL